MVNLEWYRTFKAVYKLGTLTSAAAALFISQPGVSLHISSLESYVGYKLFDRKGRKMIPTEQAKVLYNYIIEALIKLEDAEKNFQKSNNKAIPTIRIGMCFETFQITLEQYIATLPFNVIIQFGEYQEMISYLEKGILDVIITPQIVPSHQLEYEAFSSENIILIGSNDIDTAQLHTMIIQNDFVAIENWLKQHKWYGTTGDMEHLRRFWQLNFNKHADFRPNYIVPNINSIIRCLSNGTGLAVVPDFLCKKEMTAQQIQLVWTGKTLLTNTLYFATRKKNSHVEEVNLIKKLCQEFL